MQFSPSCNCCGTAAICAMCDEGTTQEEYSLTFWGGEAEESTIIVSNVGHPCVWTYQGVIGDIQGISDDGNGTCDETAVLIVTVFMDYDEPIFGGVGWFWQIEIRIECDPASGSPSIHRGLIIDTAIIDSTPSRNPDSGFTQDCNLTTGYDFTSPASYNYRAGDCDWPPSFPGIGCLDCSYVGGIYTCNYPGGTFCHMENAP